MLVASLSQVMVFVMALGFDDDFFLIDRFQWQWILTGLKSHTDCDDKAFCGEESHWPWIPSTYNESLVMSLTIGLTFW